MKKSKKTKKAPPKKTAARKPRPKVTRVVVPKDQLPPFVERVKGLKVSDFIGVVLGRGQRVAYKCGHDFEEDFEFILYGIPCQPSQKWLQTREKCGDCLVEELKRTTARCASCGHVIEVGDGVALYAYLPEDFDPKKEEPWFKFVEHDKERKSVIGCLRTACCPSGGFFAGHWTAEGFKSAFPGGASIAATAMATGKPQFANMR